MFFKGSGLRVPRRLARGVSARSITEQFVEALQVGQFFALEALVEGAEAVAETVQLGERVAL
ncbi:MAG TPA: hypothetical protein VI299_05835, partial [Polyangiales bacterium]